MDKERFDRLAKIFSYSSTRRELLRLGASLPLAAALAALLGEASDAGLRHRRSARHRHRTGRRKDNRKGQRTGQDTGNGNSKGSCATIGQTPKTGNRANCCQGLVTDAAGRCAAPTGGGLGSGTPCLPPTADLQTAINAADSGATLTLCAGTFVDIAASITKNLTLVGAGNDQTILNNDASCICAVIEVAKGATVTVQGLAIVKRSVSYWGFVNYGTLSMSEVDITGGGLPANGAGIYNEGTLTLGAGANIFDLSVSSSGAGIYNDGGVVRLGAGSNVTNNHAVFGSGGGIHNDGGTLTVEAGSNVTANFANDGGGIYSDGTLTLQVGSSVTGNGAGTAGGIYNGGGTATLEAGSSVTNNNGNADAGGIYNNGTLTLKTGSSVTDNTTIIGSGGGIYNDGTLTLQDGSSVTGNTVGGTGGDGGGIFNTGTVILEAGAKVTGNTVENLQGLGGDGGGIANGGGTVTLADGAVVCGNTAPTDPDCSGPITGTCPQLPPGGICPV